MKSSVEKNYHIIMITVIIMTAALTLVGFSLWKMFRGAEAQAARPNIIWLVQDHVTWKQYTETGGDKPKLRTFERIAQDGVVFEQARSVLPICSPSRASMLTGVYPHKHGITGNDQTIRQQNDFAPDYTTFNNYLTDQNYVAAYFGKWHAAASTPASHNFQGFSDRGYGNPYTTAAYKNYLKQNNLPDPTVEVEWVIGDDKPFGTNNYKINMLETQNFYGQNPNGFRAMSAGKFEAPFEAHESYFVAKQAADWLEKYAEDTKEAESGTKPFVMRVDVWGPHQPYFIAPEFQGLIDPKSIPEYPNFKHEMKDRPAYHMKQRSSWQSQTGLTDWAQWQPIIARAYESMIQSDAALGLVLDALERTGLDENTVIIYTADHGDIIGSGGGLLDKDAFMTEEVMRIPLAIKWPGVTKPGTSDKHVSHMDIVPTILEMGGADIPSFMDGDSLVPLLKNPRKAKFRDVFMAQHYGHKNEHVFQRAFYFDNYKYVAHLNDRDELYDLSKDPFEQHNLIEDPEMEKVKFDMMKRLMEKMGEHGDVGTRQTDLLFHQMQQVLEKSS